MVGVGNCPHNKKVGAAMHINQKWLWETERRTTNLTPRHACTTTLCLLFYSLITTKYHAVLWLSIYITTKYHQRSPTTGGRRVTPRTRPWTEWNCRYKRGQKHYISSPSKEVMAYIKHNIKCTINASSLQCSLAYDSIMSQREHRT